VCVGGCQCILQQSPSVHLSQQGPHDVTFGMCGLWCARECSVCVYDLALMANLWGRKFVTTFIVGCVIERNGLQELS